jgi:amino acid transporter
VEGASIPVGAPGLPAGAAGAEKGLKTGAISFISNVVIGVASTAPGYSLAATLGFVTATVGVGFASPAIFLVAFAPMLCIALAYNYMNRADPDCGTTFSWVTRAMGPSLGWLGGWAIIVADIIVMANLAQIAGIYTFQLFGLTAAANNVLDQTIVGILWIVVMTWICWRGIELSARTQQALLGLEFVTLLIFAVVALVTVYVNHPVTVSGGHVYHSVQVSASWFDPTSIGTTPLINGVLLAVFIYWGWDTCVTVNEETKNAGRAPGRAAVVSTLMLLAIYLVVTVAAQAYGGAGLLSAHADDIFSGTLGTSVLGSGLDKLLIIAVLSSASASTQTTILPTARTSFAMARAKAFPRVFARIHQRFQTPDVSTLAMGAASIAWYIAISNLSSNLLADSIVAIGFAIAFYYGLTGYACVIYFRRELFKNIKNFIYIGVLPLAGALMLTGIFVKALIFYQDSNNDSTNPVFGIGTPVFIGVGSLVLGIVVMLVARPFYRDFFKRKLEVADPHVLDDDYVHPSLEGQI